jgi:hypothetical protein
VKLEYYILDISSQSSIGDLYVLSYTPSRKDQIEGRFDARPPQLHLPPDAWPSYIAPILRGSLEAPGVLEVAPAMFGMVPQCANEMLAQGAAAARRSCH